MAPKREIIIHEKAISYYIEAHCRRLHISKNVNAGVPTSGSAAWPAQVVAGVLMVLEAA